jgi:hypothetical protein
VKRALIYRFECETHGDTVTMHNTVQRDGCDGAPFIVTHASLEGEVSYRATLDDYDAAKGAFISRVMHEMSSAG